MESEIELVGSASGSFVTLVLHGRPNYPDRIVEALAATASFVEVDERLGLRLARRWLEAEGGGLAVETVGHGLTLRLSVPAEPVRETGSPGG